MKRNCNNLRVFLVSSRKDMVYCRWFLSRELNEALDMKAWARRPLRRFLILLLAAGLLQILFHFSLRMQGDGGALLLVFNMYALLPAASVLLPFWAGKGGVHPFAAFFPVGGAALVFSSIPAWVSVLCMLLSLVAAVAGQEWTKRNETEKKGHHGGRNQKR